MKVDRQDLLKITSRSELRAWLSRNYQTALQAWVPYSTKPQPGRVLYLDLVEEALCFGWIDGLAKRYQGMLLRRITPRRNQNRWSELNKARLKRLDQLGLVTTAGRAAMPKDKFTVDARVKKALEADSVAKANFDRFPKLYQRIRIDNIQDALRNHHEGTFHKRLDKLILYSKFNLMYGQWNDGGRLLR